MDLVEFTGYIKYFTRNKDDLTNIDDAHAKELVDLIMQKFNKLSDRDKLFFLMTDISCEIDNINSKQDATLCELDTIESENKKEMIKLRSWLVKAIVITLIVIMLFFLALGTMSGNGDGGIVGSFIDTFMKITSVLFK